MASLTAILGLRKPAGTDIVNVVTDISDNMQKIDDAFAGVLPLGIMLPYTLDVAPTDPKWVIADGALVPTATYPDYFAKVGHKYNNNVDPGGGQFKLPSAVDKMLVGAGVIAATVTAPVGSHPHNKTGGVSAGDANHGHGNTGGEGAPDHLHGLGGSTFGAQQVHIHVDTAFGGGQYSGAPDQDHGHGLPGTTGASDRGLGHVHSSGPSGANHGHGDTLGIQANSVGNALGLLFIVKVKP